MTATSSTDRLLFITGMFRSGTTLLAMMCQNHPRMRMATDPYANLFRAFRNQVASIAGLPIDPDSPMDDYYFDPAAISLMGQVQATSLDLKVDPPTSKWLRDKIDETARRYAPELGDFPQEPFLTTSRFSDFFASAFRLIASGSGKNPDVAGFKQVWMGEFTHHILEAFPKARVIHLIRDPRGVCASKQKRDAKYPWLFMARQWRKHACFAWKARHDRVMLIQYEDLVANPEKFARDICAFLEVKFEASMIEPGQFLDGSGKPWSANSAHRQNLKAFDPKLADLWQETLSEREIRWIEALCLPEMTLFGYSPRFPADPGAVSKLPLIRDEELAAWVRPYANRYQDAALNRLDMERLRLESLARGTALSTEEKTRLFLDPAFYDAVSASFAAQTHRTLEGMTR